MYLEQLGSNITPQGLQWHWRNTKEFKMPFYEVFCAAAAHFAVLYKTLGNNVCTNLVFLEENNFIIPS